MPAGKYDIKIEQGATLRLGFVWLDSEDAPVDLTGYSSRLHIKKRSTDDDVLVDLSNYLTITPAEGRVDLLVPDDVTAEFAFRTAEYDLKLDGGEQLSIPVDRGVSGDLRFGVLIAV